MILTDLNMPGMDGFGFLQRLRDSGEMPPTIVLTAFGNIETAVKTVHELGALLVPRKAHSARVPWKC